MISQDVLKYMRAIGKKGGQARAKNMHQADRSAQARKAVLSRWMKGRFKTDCFANMGIPGSDIVDAGLQDLANGNFLSVNALAVEEVRHRLRFLGVPVPKFKNKITESRFLLYQKMKQKHGDMAYARFCALLERVDSFCDALSSLLPIPKDSLHQNRRWYA